TFSFNMVAPGTVGTYNSQWRMVQDNVEWFGDTTPNIAVKDGVNAALFVSQTVPATMTPGQTYAVSVTMQNTGNTTWTAGSLYNLGSQNAQDNTTWGLFRVPLPNSVAPGASVTFNFNMVAPSMVGTYNSQWRMVQDNVEWFGDYTPNIAVKDGVNSALFVSQTVPATMTPGQTYAVSVTMQNTGNTTWTAGTQYRLGSQNAQDNTTWGPLRVELPNSVAPGSNVTFNFNVTAPATPNTYNFQWRMVQDAVEWFGDYSANVAVKDGVNAALFVSQSVPATFTPGQTKTVSVTFQNTGTTTWTDATQYHLGTQNPQDNSTWGLQRVSLPGPIAPGASVTFSFSVTAPATVGTYNFQWRMVQDYVEWFGDFSANAAVGVQGVAAAKVYYIHPDHLNTPRLVADEAQKAVWKWDQQEPFGNSVPDEDPDQDSTSFTLNLRFPGQYFDRETNLSYNYFRDYDPSIGRYAQSDIVGLGGGLNTYAYTGGTPVAQYDQFGLSPALFTALAVGGVSLYVGYKAAGPFIDKALSWTDLLNSRTDSNQIKNLLDSASIGCLQYKDEAACGRMYALQEQYIKCTVGDRVNAGANVTNTPSGGLPGKAAGAGLEILKKAKP
ncbi:MAG: hypothetical protein JSS40_12445, partial [Proteobacteria bacterium]|nr:hypothetical protein [Pseudomonadota bacterium]